MFSSRSITGGSHPPLPNSAVGGSANVQVSRVFRDYGNKYRQDVAGDTPFENVTSLSVGETGIRMEDYGSVRRLPGGGFIIVICDGHGAVPLTPTRFVGGYETAKFVTERLMERLEALANDLVQEMQATPPSTTTTVGTINVPLSMRDIFRATQEDLISEYNRGAEPVYYISTPQFRRVSLYPEAADQKMYQAKTEQRRQDLMRGQIDGFHFQQVMADPKAFFDEQQSRGQNPRAVVTDKILLPIPDPRDKSTPVFVAFYTNMNDEIIAELDYGCTCTVALVLPEGGGTHRMRLYVAHVGDSDAYVFPAAGNIPNNGSDIIINPVGPTITTTPVDAVRVVADHTVNNASEANRLQPFGVEPHPPYFQIMDPLPVFSTRAIMPSRTFGHSLFRHYGLTSDPHVASQTLYPGDTLVVGTDGLWDDRWDARQVIRHYLQSHRHHGHNNSSSHYNETMALNAIEQSQQQEEAVVTSAALDRVGADVLSSLKTHLPVQDNIAFVILQVNENE